MPPVSYIRRKVRRTIPLTGNLPSPSSSSSSSSSNGKAVDPGDETELDPWVYENAASTTKNTRYLRNDIPCGFRDCGSCASMVPNNQVIRPLSWKNKYFIHIPFSGYYLQAVEITAAILSSTSTTTTTPTTTTTFNRYHYQLLHSTGTDIFLLRSVYSAYLPYIASYPSLQYSSLLHSTYGVVRTGIFEDNVHLDDQTFIRTYIHRFRVNNPTYFRSINHHHRTYLFELPIHTVGTGTGEVSRTSHRTPEISVKNPSISVVTDTTDVTTSTTDADDEDGLLAALLGDTYGFDSFSNATDTKDEHKNTVRTVTSVIGSTVGSTTDSTFTKYTYTTKEWLTLLYTTLVTVWLSNHLDESSSLLSSSSSSTISSSSSSSSVILLVNMVSTVKEKAFVTYVLQTLFPEKIATIVQYREQLRQSLLQPVTDEGTDNTTTVPNPSPTVNADEAFWAAPVQHNPNPSRPSKRASLIVFTAEEYAQEHIRSLSEIMATESSSSVSNPSFSFATYRKLVNELQSIHQYLHVSSNDAVSIREGTKKVTFASPSPSNRVPSSSSLSSSRVKKGIVSIDNRYYDKEGNLDRNTAYVHVFSSSSSSSSPSSSSIHTVIVNDRNNLRGIVHGDTVMVEVYGRSRTDDESWEDEENSDSDSDTNEENEHRYRNDGKNDNDDVLLPGHAYGRIIWTIQHTTRPILATVAYANDKAKDDEGDETLEKEEKATVRIDRIRDPLSSSGSITLTPSTEGSIVSATSYTSFAIPVDNRYPWIRIRSKQIEQLRGQRILVTLEEPYTGPTKQQKYPEGRITKVLGSSSSFSTNLQSILYTTDLHAHTETISTASLYTVPSLSFATHWSVAADRLHTWDKIWNTTYHTTPSSSASSASLSPSTDAFFASYLNRTLSERKDLRWTHSTFTVTSSSLPSSHSTVIDQAYSVREIGPKRYEIGIHVPDTTYFIPHDNDIESIARQRGTTIDLGYRQYPLLPSLLSDYVCSLRGRADRYTVSILWEIEEVEEEGKNYHHGSDTSVSSTPNPLYPSLPFLTERTYRIVPDKVWMGRTIIRTTHALNDDQAERLLYGLPADLSKDEYSTLPMGNPDTLLQQDPVGGGNVLTEAAKIRGIRNVHDLDPEISSNALAIQRRYHDYLYYGSMDPVDGALPGTPIHTHDQPELTTRLRQLASISHWLLREKGTVERYEKTTMDSYFALRFRTEKGTETNAFSSSSYESLLGLSLPDGENMAAKVSPVTMDDEVSTIRLVTQRVIDTDFGNTKKKNSNETTMSASSVSGTSFPGNLELVNLLNDTVPHIRTVTDQIRILADETVGTVLVAVNPSSTIVARSTKKTTDEATMDTKAYSKLLTKAANLGIILDTSSNQALAKSIHGTLQQIKEEGGKFTNDRVTLLSTLMTEVLSMEVYGTVDQFFPSSSSNKGTALPFIPTVGGGYVPMSAISGTSSTKNDAGPVGEIRSPFTSPLHRYADQYTQRLLLHALQVGNVPDNGKDANAVTVPVTNTMVSSMDTTIKDSSIPKTNDDDDTDDLLASLLADVDTGMMNDASVNTMIPNVPAVTNASPPEVTNDTTSTKIVTPSSSLASSSSASFPYSSSSMVPLLSHLNERNLATRIANHDSNTLLFTTYLRNRILFTEAIVSFIYPLRTNDPYENRNVNENPSYVPKIEVYVPRYNITGLLHIHQDQQQRNRSKLRLSSRSNDLSAAATTTYLPPEWFYFSKPPPHANASASRITTNASSLLSRLPVELRHELYNEGAISVPFSNIQVRHHTLPPVSRRQRRKKGSSTTPLSDAINSVVFQYTLPDTNDNGTENTSSPVTGTRTFVLRLFDTIRVALFCNNDTLCNDNYRVSVPILIEPVGNTVTVNNLVDGTATSSIVPMVTDNTIVHVSVNNDEITQEEEERNETDPGCTTLASSDTDETIVHTSMDPVLVDTKDSRTLSMIDYDIRHNVLSTGDNPLPTTTLTMHPKSSTKSVLATATPTLTEQIGPGRVRYNNYQPISSIHANPQQIEYQWKREQQYQQSLYGTSSNELLDGTEEEETTENEPEEPELIGFSYGPSAAYRTYSTKPQPTSASYRTTGFKNALNAMNILASSLNGSFTSSSSSSSSPYVPDIDAHGKIIVKPEDLEGISAYKSKTGSGLSAQEILDSYDSLKNAETGTKGRSNKLFAEKRHDRIDKLKKQNSQ